MSEDDLEYEQNPDLPEEEEDLGEPPKSISDENKASLLKKELSKNQEELETLLTTLPDQKPSPNSPEYAAYEKVLEHIEKLKTRISETQDALMEFLKDLEDFEEK